MNSLGGKSSSSDSPDSDPSDSDSSESGSRGQDFRLNIGLPSKAVLIVPERFGSAGVM
jgi:hypothetical protein